MKWEDGWPVLGVDGKVPDDAEHPREHRAASRASWPPMSSTGSPATAALPLAWQWNHNPDNRYWSLTARPGFLRLTTGRVDTDFVQARNTLTQRTFGPECSGTVALDVSHMKDGDYRRPGRCCRRSMASSASR